MEFPTWSPQSTKTDITSKSRSDLQKEVPVKIKKIHKWYEKKNTTDWVVWLRLTNHTQVTKIFYKLIVPQLYSQQSTKPVCEADI